jgi:hypothetical protein
MLFLFQGEHDWQSLAVCPKGCYTLVYHGRRDPKGLAIASASSKGRRVASRLERKLRYCFKQQVLYPCKSTETALPSCG